MGLFIIIPCLLILLGGAAIVMSLLYAVSRPLAASFADRVVNSLPARMFSLFHCYLGFNYIPCLYDRAILPPRFLLISNHQSILDIPLYMVYFHGLPIRFVAKDQLSRNVPMVSTMLRSQGHCFIPRTGSPRRAMNRLESFAHRTGEKGQIPVIFPEGTRSRDGELGSFYPAGFRRLLETRSLPVVVCALDGAHKLAGLLGILRHLRGASYRVKLLKLYDAPKSKEDMLRILGEARSLIQNQLHAWRQGHRGH